MKRAFLFTAVVIPLVFAAGCGEERKAATIRAENQHNLTKATLGMTRAELLELMGDKTAKVSFGKNAMTVTNPYRNEIREVGDHTYEILWYYTHQDQKDYPFKRFVILDRELTPVVLENGKVIGWGNDFLNKKLTER